MSGHVDIDGAYHPWPTGVDQWCPKDPFYNAEDDLWFDALAFHPVMWSFTWPPPQSVRDMTTPVIDIEGLRAIATGQLGEYIP